MNKYAIWNKQDPIITPIGEVLTAAQWIERYPVAALDSITVICSAGEINGGYFGTLGQMVATYESMGCDFSGCETAEDKLNSIEMFDKEREEAAKAAALAVKNNEERSAVALEAIAAGQTAESTAVIDALLNGEG